MFIHNLDSDFHARNIHPFYPTYLASRNFGLGLPPDVPRAKPVRTLPRVSWPDIGLAFLAGVICAGLGFVGAVWYFGG